MAVESGAPFAKTSLDRMHGNIFGSGRGPRSTDVVIFNKSDKSFTLTSSYCKYGGFSTDIFPEHQILAKMSSVYGIAANGFMTGVRCTAKYESPNDGSYFEVTSRNPYVGSNSMKESHSESLKLTPTLGIGHNNQVRWIVENSEGDYN